MQTKRRREHLYLSERLDNVQKHMRARVRLDNYYSRSTVEPYSLNEIKQTTRKTNNLLPIYYI